MTLASHGTIEQNAKEPWMVRLNEFVQVRCQTKLNTNDCITMKY